MCFIEKYAETHSEDNISKKMPWHPSAKYMYKINLNVYILGKYKIFKLSLKKLTFYSTILIH